MHNDTALNVGIDFLQNKSNCSLGKRMHQPEWMDLFFDHLWDLVQLAKTKFALFCFPISVEPIFNFLSL